MPGPTYPMTPKYTVPSGRVAPSNDAASSNCAWVTNAAVFLVDRYRHDIASIITETVERWDPDETTEKIELMVGRDLQYIRLNGTFVGAHEQLAAVATVNALLTPIAGTDSVVGVMV